MLQGLPEPARESLAMSVLFPNRLGEAEEIARVAQMLIENDYMNGETVRMDTMPNPFLALAPQAA